MLIVEAHKMVLGVPTNFQAISNVLANYNFVDIASGTGFINFYAGTTVDLKLLSNFTYYSDVIAEPVANAPQHDAYATLLFDHDFDVLLNRPLDVAGLTVVNVPIMCRNTANGAQGRAYATVKLRKWDGTTETEIATNDSRIVINTSNPNLPAYYMLAIDLNVPITHFKKGEYLRLTIQLRGGGESAGGTNVSYAHDPKNRTTGWDTTGAVPSQLIFACPVRLNL